MKAHLTIQERFSQGAEESFRKRTALIDGESITLGGSRDADIELRDIEGSVLLEIKFALQNWWLINFSRSDLVRIKGKIAALETRLSHNDEIEIAGHRIRFEIPEKRDEPGAPTFGFQYQSDQELWDLLIGEDDFDEVLINGAEEIFVDYGGQLFKAPYRFQTNEFLRDRIIELTKKDSGWGSARLHRMLRIQTALPPVVEVPHLAIRKSKRFVMKLASLLERGFGTLEEMDFLKRAIKEKQNILITGGTSTGKTVLLRSLVEQIDETERVVIVEEEAETDWPHPHAVAIESGRGQLRGAVIECLRMRPSRLIVSEVRGSEAYEMMQAMNTGHAGSMSTLHANSPREALSRLEGLVLSAGVGTNLLAVRKQIAHAIHAIVHLTREASGRRRIDQIVRIGGVQNETILLSDPIKTESSHLKQKVFKLDS